MVVQIPRNVFVNVAGIEDSDFYKSVNKNGNLKQLFTSNQLTMCKEKLISMEEILTQQILLREAASANLKSGGQAIHAVTAKTSVPRLNVAVKARGFL